MAKLSDRLSKLEHATGEALPQEAMPLLVQILARRDAMFWPTRSLSVALILKQRQRAYRSRELGIAAKADGRANWKVAHHHRKALIGAGLVEPLTSGGQVTSLLLTPRGEFIARGLVGLLSPSDVAIFTEMIPSDWTREQELGVEGEDQSVRFNEQVLPLLVAGAVEVRCDSRKGLWYRSVGAVEEDGQICPPIDPVQAHQATYDAAFMAEREALESSELLDPYEVFIPIPSGL